MRDKESKSNRGVHYKAEAIKAAKDLRYGDEVVRKIRKAKSERQNHLVKFPELWLLREKQVPFNLRGNYMFLYERKGDFKWEIAKDLNGIGEK